MASIDIEDTIAAIASPPGNAVRGIVRISGPNTVAVIDQLFAAETGQSLSKIQKTDSVSGAFQIPADSFGSSGVSGEIKTQDTTVSTSVPGELLIWPTRQSYTRQPTAEFHTVGSTPILQMVLNAICNAGARLAKPGEFTLRAFLSGRIDLTQAEAVLAVIDSDGQQQLDTALQQLAGGLAGPLGEIRGQLMGTLAELEAGLDFVEEDIEFISQSELSDQLTVANDQLTKIVDQISSRDLAVGSVKAVLFGMPNSGKSSLLNALTQSEIAIVTNVPGTTTDFISAKLEIDATSIELVDTAGFEQASLSNIVGEFHEHPTGRRDEVIDLAQTHRDRQQDQAHISLLCIDRSRKLTQWEIEQLEHVTPSTIVVLTKSDLPPETNFDASTCDCPTVETSSVQQEEGLVAKESTSDWASNGLERLKGLILEAVNNPNSDRTVVSSTIARATQSLREAQTAVSIALEATQTQAGEEIVAAEIRQSLEGLGQVVGTVYTDDILDLVFGRFCIGK